jgi:predicted DCC family thiol-disulfide oxidoreductase YuxK
MCRRTVRFLHAVDWFGRLEIKDMMAVPSAELPVSMDVAMTGMPMRTRDGRVFVGFAAVRRALSQTVAGPVGWIMYVPGVSRAGDRVYQWVARNRRRACSMQTKGRPAGSAS